MSRGVHLATNVPKISLQEAIGSTVGTIEGSAGKAVTKVRDQHGSTAGAGSGALAVYRKHRRLETARIEEMERQDKIDEIKALRLQKIKNNEILDEEELKKRQKRRRKLRTSGKKEEENEEEERSSENAKKTSSNEVVLDEEVDKALEEELKRLESELVQ